VEVASITGTVVEVAAAVTLAILNWCSTGAALEPDTLFNANNKAMPISGSPRPMMNQCCALNFLTSGLADIL
jgi:hypothetical protein